MFPKQRKEIQSYSLFKNPVKSKLIKTENEVSFCFLQDRVVSFYI